MNSSFIFHNTKLIVIKQNVLTYSYLTGRTGTKFVTINFQLLNSNFLDYLKLVDTEFYYLNNVGLRIKIKIQLCLQIKMKCYIRLQS